MRIRSYQTTTFRLTVFTSLASIIAGGAVLAFFYWSMVSAVDAQIDSALGREFDDMNAAYIRGGYGRLRRTVADRASPHYDAVRVYLLVGPDGTLTGNLRTWPAEAPPPDVVADIAVSHAAGTARVRTLTFGDGSRLVVGRALTEHDTFRAIVTESLLSVLLANLVLGIAAGILLARYARRRLSQINAAARQMLAKGETSGKIMVGEGGDEYDLLARNINSMLARIQRLVTTVRGVTENIAHDLRTPLNRLRGRLEVALMAPRSPEEYRSELQRAVAEADTIVNTFNGILKIARIKAGALALPKDPVDLTEVVEELVDLYQVFAEENEVVVEVRLSDGGGLEHPYLCVSGDAHLISQAAANLLDNAIKYSPRGGTVTIAAVRRQESVSLEIADHGPGIPAEKRAAARDRFVRLDAAKSKQGYGLGLNFVAVVAEWHGGRLELADNEPGLRASLTFPFAGE